MRKCLYILSTAILLCGCSKSIEEKAKDIVIDNVRGRVTNKESLQVISISVDSCYYDIMSVDKLLMEYQEFLNEYEYLCSKSTFAWERYESAKVNAKSLFDAIMMQKRFDEYLESFRTCSDYKIRKIYEQEKEIQSLLRPEGTKEFKCYKVNVKYKAEAAKGIFKEHAATYYVKPDITGILKALDLENDTCRHYKQKFNIEEDSLPKML